MGKKSLFSKTLFGGSTALEVFGQIGDAKSAWETGVINRKQAYEDARRTEEAGKSSLEQFMRDARGKLGQETAIASHQGGVSGSAQFILADLANQLEKEAGNIRTDTASKASALRTEGDAWARRGANKRKQNYLKSAGTLMARSYEYLDL